MCVLNAYLDRLRRIDGKERRRNSEICRERMEEKREREIFELKEKKIMRNDRLIINKKVLARFFEICVCNSCKILGSEHGNEWNHSAI